MMVCTTTSGDYRCTKQLDASGKHAGECEARAREYVAIGPTRARDVMPSRLIAGADVRPGIMVAFDAQGSIVPAARAKAVDS